MGIIVAYLCIFCILRKHYMKEKVDARMRKVMNKNLYSLLVLFVSICAIYAYRIYRDI